MSCDDIYERHDDIYGYVHELQAMLEVACVVRDAMRCHAMPCGFSHVARWNRATSKHGRPPTSGHAICALDVRHASHMIYIYIYITHVRFLHGAGTGKREEPRGCTRHARRAAANTSHPIPSHSRTSPVPFHPIPHSRTSPVPFHPIPFQNIARPIPSHPIPEHRSSHFVPFGR